MSALRTAIDPRRSCPIFLLPSVQQVVGGAGGEAALGPAFASDVVGAPLWPIISQMPQLASASGDVAPAERSAPTRRTDCCRFSPLSGGLVGALLFRQPGQPRSCVGA